MFLIQRLLSQIDVTKPGPGQGMKCFDHIMATLSCGRVYVICFLVWFVTCESDLSAAPVPDEIVKRLDTDKNGELSLKEFLTGKENVPGQRRLFFQRDTNENLILSFDELKIKTPKSTLSVTNNFRYLDQNNDDQLTAEEYSASSKNLKLSGRNFKVIDFNENGHLDLEEFKALPGLYPTMPRGAVPDPVAEFAAKAQTKWQVLQKTADQNADGQLSKEEWPLEELRKQLTPLAEISFAVWDKDQDGQVSSQESEELISTAYGMQQVNGAPLRTPEGLVLYRFYINRTDKDNDYRISKAEYMPSVRFPEEKKQENFKKMDRDQDGYLSYQELTKSSATNIDEFKYFLSSDKDLDGFLSYEELLKVGSNSSAKQNLIPGIAAFDENKDGKFSLREFRLAPIGISYVTLRVYDRKDLDHDGTLSWKEFYQEPSPQVIGLAWELFQRFDRDHSGELDLDEFEFKIDPSKMPPEKTFVFKDKNKDGALSLEEYLATVPTVDPQLAKRNYHIVDFNRNEQLELEEYTALPGLMIAAKRGPVPDPVVEFAAKAYRKWKLLQKTADRNTDGQLSQMEWPRQELQKQLPGVADVIFPQWDRNRDGMVSEKEAKQLIDIAYGIKTITGAPLRTPNGLVLYRSYFKTTDKNRDHRLSQREYLTSIRLPFKKVLALFNEMDADKDQYLTYQEITTSSTTNIDEFNYFLSTDKDLDGFLSAEELLKINSNGVVESRLPQGLAAFDEDRDGKYSLREFRLSPVGCCYVTLRVYGREDEDHDGMLSWKEFYKEPSPEVIGLAWELFQRFDRNDNNQLEINEFEFRFTPATVQPELYFHYADKDKNGVLTFTEVFTVKEPENKATQGYERFSNQQKQAKDKFEQDDQNNDGSLDEDEFVVAHETARKLEEQHLRALGRLKTPNEEPEWLFPVMMTVNVLFILCVGVFIIRRKLR